jgi:hypothetical protein
MLLLLLLTLLACHKMVNVLLLIEMIGISHSRRGPYFHVDGAAYAAAGIS